MMHDVFGNTFSEGYAPRKLDIASKVKALCLSVSEIDVFLWKWPAMFFNWPPKWRIQWHDLFDNTFSEIYAQQILDIELKLKSLSLLQ